MKNLTKLVVFAALSVCSHVASANLILNGDFETGDFSSWTVDAVGDASVFVAVDPGDPTLGPSLSGDNYAFSGNQTGPSRNIFTQLVTLPDMFSALQFSFDYAFFTTAGLVTPEPDSLQFQPLGGTPTQQVRMEILLGSADFDSVDPLDIIYTAFRTTTGGDNDVPWTSFSSNITSALSGFAGQNILVRFAQIDNQNPFDFGFDNVALVATNDVPTPPVLLLIVFSVLGLVSLRTKA